MRRRGLEGAGWGGDARFYAEIKVRIEWRLVQMHTDVKVVRGYLVKKSGGKLLRRSRVKQDKEEDILINIYRVFEKHWTKGNKNNFVPFPLLVIKSW